MSEQKEYYKKYREEHKEAHKEYMKEWYIKNKDKHIANCNTLVPCECGAMCAKSHLPRHRRSRKHQKYLTNVINKQQ